MVTGPVQVRVKGMQGYRYGHVFLTLQIPVPMGRVDRFSWVMHVGTLCKFQPRFQQVSNPLGRHYQLHAASTSALLVYIKLNYVKNWATWLFVTGERVGAVVAEIWLLLSSSCEHSLPCSLH